MALRKHHMDTPITYTVVLTKNGKVTRCGHRHQSLHTAERCASKAGHWVVISYERSDGNPA